MICLLCLSIERLLNIISDFDQAKARVLAIVNEKNIMAASINVICLLINFFARQSAMSCF